MHLSRLAEDFIIYNSDAFALISFNDNMLTGSSIMPQKKNPDPAELIRGKVGVSYGKLNSLLTICLLYTSPSPRDLSTSRMPSSA